MGNESNNILELKLQHANAERELAKAQLSESRIKFELLRQNNGSLQSQFNSAKTELSAVKGELYLANDALKRLGEKVAKHQCAAAALHGTHAGVESACGAEPKAAMTDPTYGVNQSIGAQDSVRDAGEFETRTFYLRLNDENEIHVIDEIKINSLADIDLLATALAAGVAAFKAMRT